MGKDRQGTGKDTMEWREVTGMTDATDRAGGPISLVRRTTAKEIGDRIEAEWTLSAKPGLEWAEVFQFTSVMPRTGPVDWVQGGGPDVEGDVVRWFVPTACLEEADAEVQQRLETANTRSAA